MTQAELAQRFGVHVMTISKWERGLYAIPAMVDLALLALEYPPKRRSAAQRGEGMGREHP